MNIELSDKQKIMLLKAAESNGVISIEDAKQIYSNKSSAKSSIQKLETLDFVERINPGHWKVLKAIDDVRSSINITQQQEMLLMKAVKNNGIMSRDLADSMYHSRSSAKSALQLLNYMDFIESTSPGYWKVNKITHDVKEQLDAEA